MPRAGQSDYIGRAHEHGLRGVLGKLTEDAFCPKVTFRILPGPASELLQERQSQAAAAAEEHLPRTAEHLLSHQGARCGFIRAKYVHENRSQGSR